MADGKTYQEYFSLKEGGHRIRGAKRAAIKRRVASSRPNCAAGIKRRWLPTRVRKRPSTV